MGRESVRALSCLYCLQLAACAQTLRGVNLRQQMPVSVRTGLRTVAMRTNQNALVCVVTPLVTGPLVTSPKRRFPC